MQITLTKEEPTWVRIQGCSQKLAAFVKTVKPTTRRKFDADTGDWWVYWLNVGQVVQWARGLGYTVDWSELPEVWQMIAAGATVSSEIPLESLSSPYDTLFVTSDAPDSVVKAAYRVLAAENHPDVGGNAEEFIKIDDAYKRIQRIRNQK